MTKDKKQDGSVHTDGGAYIGGGVNTGGGDFVGRDKNLTAGERGVVVGGNVSGSTIVTGDGNVVGQVELHQHFQPIYERIAASPLPLEDKADLEAEVRQVEAEVAKGAQADESALARHLRFIGRIAPDILDVVLATLQGPVAGFSMVAKKVASKVQESKG